MSIGLLAWAIGVGDTESSDMGSAPYRFFAAVGFLVMLAIVISELVGLRNTRIELSEEGISAPHGWGRRMMTVRWDELADVEVYRVPKGEVVSLRPSEGLTMRIGLREVDDPEGLVAAVKEHWDASRHDV